MKNICFIATRYPNRIEPTKHVFLKNLVVKIADMGFNCTVIAPIPIHKSKKFHSLTTHVIEHSKNGNEINIFYPRYLSLGEKKRIGLNPVHISLYFFYKSCASIIEKHKISPDVFYGHFICMPGICACKLSKKFKRPSFIAYGESSDWSIKKYGIKKTIKDINNVAGVISVSSYNKEKLLGMNVVTDEKVKVFVNGVDTSSFLPIDKALARVKFGFDQNDFIISFVGQFIERKGINNLVEAIKDMPEVKLICAGSGPLKPNGDNILYCDKINPTDMPAFLSSSDVFVLPTQNEGCCNAILEAMACGLPIISSDLPFNKDVLDSENALLINPYSTEEITMAIKELKSNLELRTKLSRGSLKRAKMLSLEQRAANIKDWINSKIS
ncbi:glycosyltransferase family 4 protein [Mobilitalea sibirica]|uniref:Glycosyltransferase family 4 protein n=1 Tax=Mobilitalea sibirica TaxID=1462919 RepID=A0A8J7H9X8_9FIRM|nr:glycosyltransferase family 4 protein [Mobilitalea sibirica]MBH1939371.1 glycosyltransferase family 4 protein [Mobilitalea sibirica]